MPRPVRPRPGQGVLLVFDYCQNLEFFNQNPHAADRTIPNSLTKRLFVQRVELVVEIDKQFKPIEPEADTEGYQQVPTPMTHASEAGSAVDVEAQHRELREGVAERLRDEILAMSVDNFIVRPKRRYVEKFAEPSTLRAEQTKAPSSSITSPGCRARLRTTTSRRGNSTS